MARRRLCRRYGLALAAVWGFTCPAAASVPALLSTTGKPFHHAR
ncbi:MAG TPA: hypothetical protein VMH92_12760 [Acidocella sp.]|nr:hypothetical protein [Acidocella sp.]